MRYAKLGSGVTRLRYLLINPFYPSRINGVNAYFSSAEKLLSQHYNVDVLENSRDESLNVFRETVVSYVTRNYGMDEVIIEAPETRAATLLLPKGWRTHVRLHCPMGVVQKYNNEPIDESRFCDELAAITNASVISSPSYGMIEELRGKVDLSNAVVNRNPIVSEIRCIADEGRDIDVAYLGRFDVLKGVDHLKRILPVLPERYKIALVGAGSIEFSNSLSRPIAILSDHVNDSSRFDILARAKVVIVPSKFENSSTVTVEALCSCTPVVSWGVGGNTEFPQSVVTTVPYGDHSAFVNAIVAYVDGSRPRESEFAKAIATINNDFLAGVRFIIERGGRISGSPYRSSCIDVSALRASARFSKSLKALISRSLRTLSEAVHKSRDT